MEHKFEPFQKVLVRSYNDNEWICNLYSHYHTRWREPHICIWGTWKYCIPFEGNEHLLGTTDNPEPKHEYKIGDAVEVYRANLWHICTYVTKKKDEHVAYSIVDNAMYRAQDDEIRPLKENQ